MEHSKVEDKRKVAQKDGIFAKIKKVKHLDILIALIVIIVAIAIYFGMMSPKKEVVTIDEDNAKFKSELEGVLSSINGVGDVKLIINYDNDSYMEIANSEHTTSKVDKDGTVTTIVTEKEPIIIRDGKGDKPIILRTEGKRIKGVVVVAEGGGDVRTKLELIEALSTLLKIDGDKIKVYEMK